MFRYEESAVASTAAIEVKPDDSRAYANKGFAYLKLHRYREAAVELDAVSGILSGQISVSFVDRMVRQGPMVTTVQMRNVFWRLH